MAWAKPQYSREEVNAAGNFLIGKLSKVTEKDKAYDIINNWRSSHSWPLHIIQKRLRIKAKKADKSSLVAQRIKRLSSISKKLERFGEMKLSQIQDLGGCRAIVKDIPALNKLFKSYQLKNRGDRGIKHVLAKIDNYIDSPKESGYRGIHLIYKYQSDKNLVYKDLKIEIQIRTKLQHAWATAIETVDVFTKQSLKSSQGEDEWLRFFALMSSAIALKEKKSLVPNTPHEKNELKRLIKTLEAKLKVRASLKSFRQSLKILEDVTLTKQDKRDAYYYLMLLDYKDDSLTILHYKKTEFRKASDDYLTYEKVTEQNDTRNVVLVSAESIDKLKIAFPNYYLDSDLFIKEVSSFLR